MRIYAKPLPSSPKATHTEWHCQCWIPETFKGMPPSLTTADGHWVPQKHACALCFIVWPLVPISTRDWIRTKSKQKSWARIFCPFLLFCKEPPALPWYPLEHIVTQRRRYQPPLDSSPSPILSPKDLVIIRHACSYNHMSSWATMCSKY